MQLTTTKAVELLNIFSAFTGYPAPVELNGKTQIVVIPYDIGPKAQWNLVKNRKALRRIKDMADELVEEKKKVLRQFLTTLDKDAPPEVNNRLFEQQQHLIDVDNQKIFAQTHELPGLLKIDAKDIRIRRTDTPIQNALEALMNEGFLDGEPDFGDK